MVRRSGGRIWFYSVPEQCEKSRYWYVSPWVRTPSHMFLAECCAEDYHGNHDGRKCDWPLVFVLFDTEDGPEIARFTVELEILPAFNATGIPDGG